jgi:hypothetical protein
VGGCVGVVECCRCERVVYVGQVLCDDSACVAVVDHAWRDFQQLSHIADSAHVGCWHREHGTSRSLLSPSGVTYRAMYSAAVSSSVGWFSPDSHWVLLVLIVTFLLVLIVIGTLFYFIFCR